MVIINFMEDFNRSFLELRLDLKCPELELKYPELELKLIVSIGIGIGNNGIWIWIELKKWNWPQPWIQYICDSWFVTDFWIWVIDLLNTIFRIMAYWLVPTYPYAYDLHK